MALLLLAQTCLLLQQVIDLRLHGLLHVFFFERPVFLQVLDESVYSVLQVITVFSAWLDTNEKVLDTNKVDHTTVDNVPKLFLSPQFREDWLFE